MSCSASESVKIPIIVDTDANNELDDQHALAYLFFNSDIFDIKGITTNATNNGGAIKGHYDEAR
jgi:inosine-uridine nucleoside N-ribohydrolase